MRPSFYADIVYASPSAFAYFELIRDSNNNVIDGIYKDVNPAYECLLGIKKEKLIGEKVSEIFEPKVLKTLWWLKVCGEVEKKQGQDKIDYYSELTQQFYRVQIFSFEKEHAAITCIESTTEVVQKLATQENLKQAESQLKLILDSTEEAICGIDLKGKCTFLNFSCMELLGINKESELVGQQIFDRLINERIPKEKITITQDILRKLTNKQKSHSDQLYFTKMDGTFFPVEYFVKPKISNGILLGGIVTFFDITKRKAKQLEIDCLAFHDPLTGLFNHIKFENLKSDYDSKKYLPLSVIMGDINGLKKINQLYCHQEGDQLLKTVAIILKRNLPENAHIARYGEDEFSILLPNTDSRKAFWYVRKIQSAIKDHNSQLNKNQPILNFSLGYETKYHMDYDIKKIINNAQDYMNKQKMLNQDSMQNILLTSIKTTLLARSQFTEEHAERLVKLAQEVGKVMNLSSYQMDELALLAELHDIGKIGIDDAILNKPGRLTDEEMAEMKKHSFIGYQIVKSIKDLDDIALPILHHHERFDGNGYPDGLTRYYIPLLSRIISVVDAYDAMTQDRPYRKAMLQKEAIAEIKRNSGTQFDPEIVAFFLKSIEE